MSVLMANRMLARQARQTAEDAHGDITAAGYDDATAAFPGIAAVNADQPEYQPGSRTWTITADPGLWPVTQQDLITDVGSGERWEVQSAQLVKHTVVPMLNHVEIQAHAYLPEGTKA